MRIKHMFKKTVRDIRGEEQENIPEVPDNLMRKCNACKAAVFVDEVKQNQYTSVPTVEIISMYPLIVGSN